MRSSVRIAALLMLSVPLCSYDGYKKCAPCAKSDLKGKVKKLTEVDVISADEREKHVYHYNEAGLLTEAHDSAWKDMDEAGGIELVFVSSVKYSYENGRLLKEEKSVNTGSKVAEVSTLEYKYDGQGRVTSVLERGPNSVETLKETVYEGAGTKTIRKIYRKKKGKEMAEDVDRRMMDVLKNGKVAETWKYRADSNDYLLNEELRYDKDGNMSEGRAYKNGGVVRLRSFTFDDEGRVASARFEIPGVNSERTYTYTYSDPDSKGNYRKLVSTEGIVTQRQIEYYE